MKIALFSLKKMHGKQPLSFPLLTTHVDLHGKYLAYFRHS